MNKFDIINDIEDPTIKQLNVDKYMLQYKMMCQTADHLRLALLRILNDKLDFSLLDENEFLTIKYKSNGKHKIDYDTIKNKIKRSQIKKVIDNSYPIIF